MKNSKTVLIAGCTGLIGEYLLHKLLQNDTITKVIAISRKPLKITHSKLENHQTDFGNVKDVEKLLVEVSDVFCCLGTTMKIAGSKQAFELVDYHYCLNLGIAATNVSKFINFHIVSSMGSSADSKIYYNKVKGRLENSLIKLPFKSLHIYRPSFLVGNRVGERANEKIGLYIKCFVNPFLIGFLKNYRAIDAERVAEFMIEKSLVASSGIYIYLSGEML